MRKLYDDFVYAPLLRSKKGTRLTDAHLQFDNADHIGTDAIYETYHRLFSEWKSNRVLLIELVLVLNHRIGFWSDMIKRDSNVQKGRDFTLVYLELYEKTEKYLITTFPID